MSFRQNVENAYNALLPRQSAKNKSHSLFQEEDVFELGVALTEESTLPRVPQVKLLYVLDFLHIACVASFFALAVHKRDNIHCRNDNKRNR